VAQDDYRIQIRIEEEHAGGLLERLGLGLSGDAAELARDLEARRLAVSRDGDEIFVYTATYDEAERARSVIQAELGDDGVAAVTGSIERWIDEEDRWSDDPPGETWEEEAVERGFAPWEVRVTLAGRSTRSASTCSQPRPTRSATCSTRASSARRPTSTPA
jgi:hypothetical protein